MIIRVAHLRKNLAVRRGGDWEDVAVVVIINVRTGRRKAAVIYLSWRGDRHLMWAPRYVQGLEMGTCPILKAERAELWIGVMDLSAKRREKMNCSCPDFQLSTLPREPATFCGAFTRAKLSTMRT